MPASRRRLRAILATVVASGALVMAPSPAGAHFTESSISLKADDKTVRGNENVLFFGKLRNKHRKCRANQEVELVRRSKKGGVIVDVDVTDADGEFSFSHDPDPNHGRFFSRYQGRGKFGYNNKHSCSKAVSDTVRIRRG